LRRNTELTSSRTGSAHCTDIKTQFEVGPTKIRNQCLRNDELLGEVETFRMKRMLGCLGFTLRSTRLPIYTHTQTCNGSSQIDRRLILHIVTAPLPPFLIYLPPSFSIAEYRISSITSVKIYL
jgi:hypothetical protein